MKTALIILGIVAVLAVPLLWLMFYGMADIKAMVIRDVDLTRLADGTYRGSYHKGRWTYDVEVEVRDHRITSAKNLNVRMDAVKDWNDEAEAAILERQSINIDVVSGATVNTKAFEKAIEVALSTPPH
jgi:uncharacterized protein with FMN-binding domain